MSYRGELVRILILSFSLCIAALTVSIESFVNSATSHPRLIKQRRKQFCYISFVTIDGKVFLVKQKRSVGQLLGVVHDAFAACIAEFLDKEIAHKVAIIPAFKKFPGKIYDDWPATIHTLARGATIKGKRSPYKKMNIKQEPQGFRREMLGWMAKHRQLIKILALDIFLCNHDRHRGNLFYNAKTDTFCAIDMDSLYRYNLAGLAHQNLLRMAEDGLFPLTTKEFLALLELRELLEYLCNKYNVDSLITLFDQLVEQAGLVEGSPLFIQPIQQEIGFSRGMIRQNYHDTKELIAVLGTIIKKAIKVQPIFKNLQVAVDFENKV